ncbi:MAG: CHY zinc finger protein [Bacillota bacterium]|uniref:CHY-type domain-containing protein n=1 Tax=Virgibacillus salarius TaxID=447199 RepID=A0A941DS86_9BACI|nr:MULTISPECIES: CHY zinc finger protein [Bacillaceae]MBR7794751.1 hypothetical protein [Virgibacillus salarius]MCC2249854.1 hypothetical protein [Virgibacillus sp. AGTR]NAZ07471.1 hypothetical protein [Agaribacter marinus]QRZ19315.1 hypothetical protein JUJ52_06415 [Virgibacillus sp. AGTR]
MIQVFGKVVDSETRCIHYHSERDVIAIKCKMCQTYYPCYYCHEEAEKHTFTRWKEEEFSNKAILCGVCKTELTINQYLQMSKCMHCGSVFNEGCRLHHHLYFD